MAVAVDLHVGAFDWFGQGDDLLVTAELSHRPGHGALPCLCRGLPAVCESLRSLARGEAIALKSFQQFADGGVIAGRKKCQAAFLRPKNKPDGETGPAFKIVLPKTSNPQAGMKMWLSKTVANGIDRARDFAPSRFR